VVTTPKTHAITSTTKRRPSDLRPRRRRRHPAPTCPTATMVLPQDIVTSN
jgi:hypothetical protein